MSCRPVQAVPQSSVRSYVIRRLDDADHRLSLQKKARGHECLDKVRTKTNVFTEVVYIARNESHYSAVLAVDLLRFVTTKQTRLEQSIVDRFSGEIL